MKTFNEFQSDIQEKASLAKLALKVGKNLVKTSVKGVKKFKKSLGKTTIPGTDMKLPLGMNRGEFGAIETGLVGIVGKKVLDRKKEKERLNNIMNFNYSEEAMAAPTNSVGDGSKVALPPTHEPGFKKKRPPIMARGKLPGARTRFKTGADFISNIRKNKYT